MDGVTGAGAARSSTTLARISWTRTTACTPAAQLCPAQGYASVHGGALQIGFYDMRPACAMESQREKGEPASRAP